MINNIFKNKCLIVIICNFFITTLIAQTPISSGLPDYNSIDKYISTNYTKKAEIDCLNILFSSNDCDKCVLYINTLLMGLKESGYENSITINVVADNVAYAKKSLSKYKLNFNYFYDKLLFEKFEINNRTLLYLKKGENIITDPDSILDVFRKRGIEKTGLIFQLNDSLVNPDKISSTLLPFDNLLTIDPKMDIAILYKKNNSEDVDKSYIASYITSVVTDSLKLFNLPERIVDKSNIKRTDFKVYSTLAKRNNMQLVKIHSLASRGFDIYVTFTLNRIYMDVSQQDKYILLGNSFVGVKKIKNEDELLDLMNVEKYDDFYLVDVFEYEGYTYPLSTWVYSTPEIIGENVFKTNVNKVVVGNENLEFGGNATIILNPKDNTAKMTALDRNAKNVRVRSNTIKFKGYNYKIEKEIIDVSNNYGLIKVTKTPIQ